MPARLKPIRGVLASVPVDGQAGGDGERVDQIDVHDIKEERHLPEHREHTREPASRMLEGGQQHQGRAERHHQNRAATADISRS